MLSPQDTLYFLHIPKTAGTTLKPLLDARFDEAEICPAELWRDLIKLPPAELERYRFFRGHFGGGGLLPLLPRPPVTITFLRKSVPLVLSTYRFIRREPNTRLHAAVQEMGFRDFVRDPRPRRNISNPQVRNLSFSVTEDPRPELLKVVETRPWDVAVRLEQIAESLGPEQKLARAVTRLRAMPFFGLTDRFDESLALLGFTFGWPPTGRVQDLMVAPPTREPVVVSDEDATLIRSFNRLDACLLEEAEGLFQKRVDAMLAALRPLLAPGERAPTRFEDDRALVLALLDRHYERRQAELAPPRHERITLDFARRLDGAGWQGRERTGFDDSFFRWTGPHTASTVDLPLAPGADYRVELRTLNALAADVLDSLALEANGQPVPLEVVEGERSVSRTYRGLIPRAAIDPTRPFTRLTLRVPRTLSKRSLDPKDPDDRSVGVAVHWLRAEALTAAPAPHEPPPPRPPMTARGVLHRLKSWRTLRRLRGSPPSPTGAEAP